MSHMRRRTFITLLGGAAAWPLAARAQQPGKMQRVGVLHDLAETDAASQSELSAFRGALAKLGWTESSNLQIELRWAAADSDRMKTLARELVDLRPDVILGRGTPVTRALARETRTIPIVFVVVADPIGSGFAVRTGGTPCDSRGLLGPRVRGGRRPHELRSQRDRCFSFSRRLRCQGSQRREARRLASHVADQV